MAGSVTCTVTSLLEGLRVDPRTSVTTDVGDIQLVERGFFTAAGYSPITETPPLAPHLLHVDFVPWERSCRLLFHFWKMKSKKWKKDFSHYYTEVSGLIAGVPGGHNKGKIMVNWSTYPAYACTQQHMSRWYCFGWWCAYIWDIWCLVNSQHRPVVPCKSIWWELGACRRVWRYFHRALRDATARYIVTFKWMWWQATSDATWFHAKHCAIRPIMSVFLSQTITCDCPQFNFTWKSGQRRDLVG